MRISACILTWNTVKTLDETLHVLRHELDPAQDEIVIVDNGSTDGCEKMATIANGENLGISVGKNQLIDKSVGDYVMFIDGDVVPVKNSIRKFYEHMVNTPDCNAIGALPNKGTDCREHCEAWCEKLEPIQTQEFPCLFYGMYHRAVFEMVRCDEGGHFGGVGYGYEDHDFYAQMKKHGIIQYVAGINKQNGRYYHELNSSIRQMGRDKYIETSKQRHDQYRAKWKT